MGLCCGVDFGQQLLGHVLDLFGFHVSREQVRLAPLGSGYGFHEGAPGAPPVEAPAPAADVGYGLSASVGYVGTHRAYNPRNADSGVVVKLSKGFGGKD